MRDLKFLVLRLPLWCGLSKTYSRRCSSQSFLFDHSAYTQHRLLPTINMLSSIASTALRRSAVAAQKPFLRAAFFSSGSHDDFAAQRKVVDGEDEALKMIKDHVEKNHVMLYMKGNPSMPMCKQ